MNARTWERGLWCATIVAGSATTWIWLREGEAAHLGLGRAMVAGAASVPTMFNADSLEAAVDEVVSNDLFQRDRAPGTPVPVPAGPQPMIAAVRPQPRLVLRGVLGGPPWDVIVDGLPGRPSGTVVREGDTVAGFVFRVVARDSVRVRSADTTWTLVLGAR